MALKINDELSDLINYPIISDRINSFIWISAAQRFHDLLGINVELNQSRKIIALHLKNDQQYTQYLANLVTYGPLPESDITWITDSHRQSEWFLKNISKTTLNSLNQIRPPAVPLHLPKKNRGIAVFDYWISIQHLNIEEKNNQNKLIQLAWQEQTVIDKYFEWLNGEDAEIKRDFFWQWLTRKNPEITNGRAKFTSHDQLLIFFDDPAFSEYSKELFSTSARKIWNQQRLREKRKNKKQCNFVLSEKTVAKLDVLSKMYKLTRTEIIEILIDSESSHQTYISERLRRKIQITTPLSD